MKHIIKILFIFTILSCKAQNVIPIYEGPQDIPSNPYYKDVDNDLNPFVGECKWEDGNNSLTLQFQKLEMYHKQFPNYDNTATLHEYFDYLIGEYQYIDNGTEQTNSLPISYNGENPYNYSMIGWNITTTNRGFPPCPECAPNTRFIWLFFGEPENSQLHGKIIMAHFIEDGIEKIRARIYKTDIINLTEDYTGPTELKVLEGIYTFIKQ